MVVNSDGTATVEIGDSFSVIGEMLEVKYPYENGRFLGKGAGGVGAAITAVIRPHPDNPKAWQIIATNHSIALQWIYRGKNAWANMSRLKRIALSSN